MIKIPHIKFFEDFYREEFKKQVQQDLLKDARLRELSESNWHWKSREPGFFKKDGKEKNEFNTRRNSDRDPRAPRIS